MRPRTYELRANLRERSLRNAAFRDDDRGFGDRERRAARAETPEQDEAEVDLLAHRLD